MPPPSDAILRYKIIDECLIDIYKPYPTMNINSDANSIFDFKFEDFELINYDPWPAIKAPVAV